MLLSEANRRKAEARRFPTHRMREGPTVQLCETWKHAPVVHTFNPEACTLDARRHLIPSRAAACRRRAPRGELGNEREVRERVERERMRGCEEEKRRSATKSKRTLTTRWAVGTVMLSGVPHSEHTLAARALRAPYSERVRHDPLSLAFWVGGAESICSHTRTCHPAPPHII